MNFDQEQKITERDALVDQVTKLRKALKRARAWIDHHIEHGSLSSDWHPLIKKEADAIDRALATTEPKK